MTVIDEHIIETIRDMQKELTTYELTPQISELRQANAELADELDRLRRDHVDLKLRHSRLSADNDDALQFNKLQSGELESARQRISELESLYMEEKERCEKCFRTFHNVELSLREQIKAKGNGSGIRDEDASLRESLDMAEGYLRQIATIVCDGEVLDDWQNLTNRVRMLRAANDGMCKGVNARIAELEALVEELSKEINDIRDSGDRAFIAALRQQIKDANGWLAQIGRIVMDGNDLHDWQHVVNVVRKLRADYNLIMEGRSTPLGPTRERFEREIAALNEKLSNQVDDIVKLRHINGQQSVEIQRLRHELEQSALRLSDNLSVIEGQRAVIQTMKANCDQLQARLLKAESPTILPESPMLSVDPEPLPLPPVTERYLSGSESWREFQMQDAGEEEVRPSLEELANHPDHRVSIPAQILLDPPSTFNPSSAEVLEDLKHRMGESDNGTRWLTAENPDICVSPSCEQCEVLHGGVVSVDCGPALIERGVTKITLGGESAE